jgi:hypothetical protein
MGTLAFFPWLRLPPQTIRCGEFELIPYARGRYEGRNATTIDLVTSAYREVPDIPIEEAVLLRLEDSDDLLAHLDEKQIDACFAFSEMVALAGLTKRRFFCQSGGYSNRDNYRLVVQQFDEPGNGVCQRTRRRDGVASHFMTAEVHRVPRPRHVPFERMELDLALLQALVTCRASSNAADFVDSIITFNLANTDNSMLSPHVELVLSSGALEKVLGCRNGRGDDLARAFTTALAPRSNIARASCPRVQASNRFSKSTTIRDVWIRDLFALRGDLAHGKVGPECPSIWTVGDHLLLASFVFPLVIKTQLANASVYAMIEEDQLAIDAFEALACAADLFTPLDKFHGRFAWNEIIRKVANDERRRKILDDLKRMDDVGDNGNGAV